MKDLKGNVIQGPWEAPDQPIPSHLEGTVLGLYHDLITLQQKAQYIGLSRTAQLLSKAEGCLKDSLVSSYFKNGPEDDQLLAQNFPE